mmetsp:Transcript_34944/g.54467  ORF Transcript_34944/g.54467 Transcript_34944/m.54467 type:complete len:86 (-) Transcript_34944:17-274(-)
MNSLPAVDRQEPVTTPDVVCHDPTPPLLVPGDNDKAIKRKAPSKSEDIIIIRSLSDLLPRIHQHAAVAKKGEKNPGPIFTFPYVK